MNTNGLMRRLVALVKLKGVAVALILFSQTVLAEEWIIRDGVNGVVRHSSDQIEFGNGVKIDVAYPHQFPDMTVTLPNGDRLVFDRVPKKDKSIALIKPAVGGGPDTIELIPPGAERDFGSAKLGKVELEINQSSPGLRKDLISLLHGVVFVYRDSQTLIIIDINQSNATQSFSSLPAEVKKPIFELLKLHKVTPPPNLITNIHTTEQLQQIFGVRQTVSVGQPDPSRKMAALATKALRNFTPLQSQNTPDCCCPNSPDGNFAKKTLLIYSPGTFQGEKKEPHDSYNSFVDYFAGSPCLEIVYNPWSAWDCLETSAANLAARVNEAVNSDLFCKVELLGFSGGGTVSVLAEGKVDRKPGHDTPVHGTALGAPFGPISGIADAIGLLSFLPPGALPLATAIGAAPCGGQELAKGVGSSKPIETPPDDKTTTTLWYALDDSWVPKKAALDGAPPEGPRVDYRSAGHVDHPDIIKKAQDQMDLNNCCGDGTQEPGEDCDNPGGICKDSASRDALCTRSCKCPALCGDGKVDKWARAGEEIHYPWVALEECDPPNKATIYCKGATADAMGFCDDNCHCRPPGCGDGVVDQNAGEQCEKDDDCVVSSSANLKYGCQSDCRCKAESECSPATPENPHDPACRRPGDSCPGGGVCDSSCQCINSQCPGQEPTCLRSAATGPAASAKDGGVVQKDRLKSDGDFESR